MKTYNELVEELCKEKGLMPHSQYPLANYDFFKEVLERYIRQSNSHIGGVVRPALDSSDGGELLPASDGEANISAGCCDHVEWVVRLGILQCANCGKPN